MNALIFVSSMLMLLSIMTYARLDSYRHFSALQAEFENYMMNTERVFVNDQAKKMYNDLHGSNQSKQNDQDRNKVQASRQLSWEIFVNAESKSKNPKIYSDTLEITKNLITQLYGDKEFFKKAVSEHPNLIEDLLTAIEKGVGELPSNQKLTNIKDISNLELHDPILNEFIYKAFKGEPKPEEKDPDPSEKIDQEDEETEERTEDTCSIASQGTIALTDFTSLNKTKKIRVYLASPTILKAIYLDDNVVNRIIETRNELYKEVKKGKDNGKATEEFKNAFKGRYTHFDEDSLLDYSVTKTNPK